MQGRHRRAGEYDQWWFRTGRFDRGAELNAAWRSDVAEVERALDAYISELRDLRAFLVDHRMEREFDVAADFASRIRRKEEENA